VEFLVAVLDAVDDLDGVFFVGRRDFDGLEAALEGAIFLDGLAVLGGVVAPMHWISPRERAGLRMLAASSEPSAEPAPTRVCSSSMKMMEF
jgi:hypothetical protein